MEFIHAVCGSNERYSVHELDARDISRPAWATLLSHIQPSTLAVMRVNWSEQPVDFNQPALYTRLHTLHFSGLCMRSNNEEWAETSLFGSLPTLPALTSLELVGCYSAAQQQQHKCIKTVMLCPSLTRLHFSAYPFVPVDQLVRLLSAPLMQQNLQVLRVPLVGPLYGDMTGPRLMGAFAAMESLRELRCCSTDTTIFLALTNNHPSVLVSSLKLLVLELRNITGPRLSRELIVALLHQHPKLVVHVDTKNISSYAGEELEYNLVPNFHDPLVVQGRLCFVGRDRESSNHFLVVCFIFTFFILSLSLVSAIAIATNNI